jgi:hypothetical protein
MAPPSALRGWAPLPPCAQAHSILVPNHQLPASLVFPPDATRPRHQLPPCMVDTWTRMSTSHVRLHAPPSTCCFFSICLCKATRTRRWIEMTCVHVPTRRDATRALAAACGIHVRPARLLPFLACRLLLAAGFSPAARGLPTARRLRGLPPATATFPRLCAHAGRRRRVVCSAAHPHVKLGRLSARRRVNVHAVRMGRRTTCPRGAAYCLVGTETRKREERTKKLALIFFLIKEIHSLRGRRITIRDQQVRNAGRGIRPPPSSCFACDPFSKCMRYLLHGRWKPERAPSALYRALPLGLAGSARSAEVDVAIARRRLRARPQRLAQGGGFGSPAAGSGPLALDLSAFGGGGGGP